MSKRQIFHVKGIPGAGKSYLLKKLPKGVAGLDTDDFWTSAWRRLARTGKQVNDRKVRALALRMMKQEIMRHNVVVVVGVTLPVKRATKTYFIQQSVADLKQAYKRVVAREVSKYKLLQKKATLARLLKMTPESMIQHLRHEYHIGAVDILAGEKSYIRMYRQAYTFEKRNGLRMLSQKKIVRDIKNSIRQT